MRSPVRIRTLVVLGLSMAALAACASPTERTVVPTDPPASAGPRAGIGTYDSRAVAIAWVRSPAFRQSMQELTREHAAAKAAGDAARVAELESRGAAQQDRVHRQGFGTEPVDDILSGVAAELPGVRERAGVSALVSKWDPSAPSAGAVDVTDDLVRLFHPDADTLRVIRDVRARAPERNLAVRTND